MLETFKLRIAKHRIGAGIGALLTPILFLILANAALAQNADETPPRGFVALFNGTDLADGRSQKATTDIGRS